MRLRYPICAFTGLIILLSPAFLRADDTTGPAQALADFAKAAADGDGAKINKLVYTHSENEKKLLQSAVDYVTACKQLKDAVTKKFGEDAAKELAQGAQLTPVDQFLQIVDGVLKDSSVDVEGDQATVKAKGAAQGDGIAMIKDKDQWKIDTSKATADWEASDWAPRIGQIKQAVETVKKAAADVASGKIATLDGLKEALQPH